MLKALACGEAGRKVHPHILRAPLPSGLPVSQAHPHIRWALLLSITILKLRLVSRVNVVILIYFVS